MVCGNKIYYGTYDGFLHVFDLLTGQVIWDVNLADYQKGLIDKFIPKITNMAIMENDLIIACGDGRLYILSNE